MGAYSYDRRIQAGSVMYHTTEDTDVESILERGLDPRLKTSTGFTSDYGITAMRRYYDHPVVFLGMRPWYSGGSSVTLKVDVSGIPLAADIPSLAEEIGLSYGEIILSRVEDGVETYRTKNQEAFKKMEPFAELYGGELRLPYGSLAKAGSSAAKAAIALTQTAAVYKVISPSRISVEGTWAPKPKPRFDQAYLQYLNSVFSDDLQALYIFRDLNRGEMLESDLPGYIKDPKSYWKR